MNELDALDGPAPAILPGSRPSTVFQAAMPQDAGAAPQIKALAPMSGSGAPPVFVPAPTQAVTRIPTPVEQQIGETSQQLRKLQTKDANPFGSPNNHPGFGGKLLHALSVAGNIAGDVFAPGTMALIPGTGLHRQFEESSLGDRLQSLEQERVENEAKAAQGREADALANYNTARPDIEQSKLDQKQQAVRQRIQQQAAARGQTVAFDEDGAPTFTDNPELQAYHTAAATALLHQANAEKAQITSEIAKNHYIEGTPEYEEAQRRLSQIDRKIQLAQTNAGLRGAEFDFNQDKFYNPQPTATERKTGDLAQSAVNQVKTMRQIIREHPEVFGPVAGRSTTAQAWLGSQSPDAQRYLSASRYLADHSAGVFGSRSVEIAKALEQLTDPKTNPAALNAALDQAETTAQHFVDAGAVHAKGGGPNREPAGAGELTNLMVNDKGEQIGYDGKQWVDAKTRKPVQ